MARIDSRFRGSGTQVKSDRQREQTHQREWTRQSDDGTDGGVWLHDGDIWVDGGSAKTSAEIIPDRIVEFADYCRVTVGHINHRKGRACRADFCRPPY